MQFTGHFTGILKEWDGTRGTIVTEPEGFRVHFVGVAATLFGIAGPIWQGMRIDFVGEFHVSLNEILAYEHKSKMKKQTTMREPDLFMAVRYRRRDSTRVRALRQRSKPGRPRP